jgi:triacylglycerol lipase
VHTGWVFASLAPTRRRLALGLLAAVLVVGGTLAGILLTRGSGSSQPAAAVQTPGPIILVPGYGGSTNSLDVLARKLRTAGRDVRTMTPVGDGRGDLNQQARALAGEVTTVRAETKAAWVDIVGYSAGGVVARLWVSQYGGAQVARRVVTLGSPHHGTSLAGIAEWLPDACPAACQQLAPDSALLAALNAGEETRRGPQFVSIWTTADRVVIPPSSAVLDGAVDISVQSVCSSSRVDHSDLPSDPIVGAMVMRELGAGPPVTFTAADCAGLSS